jgi:hypothetical protein
MAAGARMAFPDLLFRTFMNLNLHLFSRARNRKAAGDDQNTDDEQARASGSEKIHRQLATKSSQHAAQ